MAAPGVSVSTAVRSGPTGVVLARSGQYFPVGLTERGPVDAPQKVNSLADYKRLYGDRVSYGALYDDLAAFFEGGGSQAYVQRVVGAAATVGTITVVDSNASPVATIRVDAANPGAWSSRLTFQSELGSNGTGTRKATVRLDGVIVETYNNLTTVADFVTRFAASPYIRITDLASASVAPANLPAIQGAPVAVTAGNDDRAAVNTARLTAGLALFKQGLGDGAVSAPGYGSTMHAALIAHASANRRIAILTGPRTATVSDLATLGLGLGSTTGSEAAGLFGPWLQVSDGAGGIRTISPEGFVAAARAKTHEAAGPWQPPAGESSISSYIVGPDLDITRTDADTLDGARVSPIRIVQGKLRLYGWRSVSSNETDYGSLTVVDTMNRLVTECESRLETFEFNTIDARGHLFAKVQGVLIGVLEPVKTAGGLYERIDPDTREQIDPGYSVDVGSTLNTVQSIARSELKAQIAARFSPHAAFINLGIVKVGLSGSV